jgi:PAS domain S-box-containing protein
VTRERDELRGAILQMPAMITLVRGKDHVFTLANQPWLDSVGKRDVIGKPLLEAFPELVGQGFVEMMDGVFTTGETFVGSCVPADLDRTGTGKLERRWYTFNYIAHRGVDGDTIGILTFAADVTAEFLAQQEVQALNTKLRTFFALAENAPDGITVTSEGRIVYANPAFRRMLGRGEECVGAAHADLFADESREAHREAESTLAPGGAWQGMLTYLRRDGSPFVGQVSSFAIRDEEGGIRAVGGIVRDLTEQRRMEQEREALREQVIAAQERAIRELSSPLIPLAEGLMVMPLVGTINEARAGQIMETLLAGIAEQKARLAILDLTGVREVDGSAANAVLKAAQAANLLGTEVVLTGIGPDVARTLVDIGADLGAVRTRGTLQSAVAYAMGRS